MTKDNITILLVDDEPDILEIVGYNLSREGYNIIKAKNGIEGLKKAKKHLPQLIILDVMMPEMDGIELCGNIREIPQLKNVLISFLTARGEDYSLLAGYEAGADDYITKPIKPRVLVSKINALLRRLVTKDSGSEMDILDIGDIKIDREEYKVYKGENTLTLPKKEFELLYLLSSRPGKVFKREVLLSRVWGNDAIVGGRTLDVHIRKLREKIGEKYFKTIKGVGYKLEL